MRVISVVTWDKNWFSSSEVWWQEKCLAMSIFPAKTIFIPSGGRGPGTRPVSLPVLAWVTTGSTSMVTLLGRSRIIRGLCFTMYRWDFYIFKGSHQSRKKKSVTFVTLLVLTPPPPRVWQFTTYFFKASGIIRNNFGQNYFFPLKKSKYLEYLSKLVLRRVLRPPPPYPQ